MFKILLIHNSGNTVSDYQAASTISTLNSSQHCASSPHRIPEPSEQLSSLQVRPLQKPAHLHLLGTLTADPTGTRALVRLHWHSQVSFAAIGRAPSSHLYKTFFKELEYILEWGFFIKVLCTCVCVVYLSFSERRLVISRNLYCAPSLRAI